MSPEYVVLKSPVKIGDYDRVESFAKGLVNGQEYLLVTRDCKFFLTNGNGGYIEFKTINSGITMDQVNKLISDLDTKTNGDITTLETAVVSLGLEFDGYITRAEFEALALTVKSNTNLATHDNRDVLDLLSKDANDNPLYNGKQLIQDITSFATTESVDAVKLTAKHDNRDELDKIGEDNLGNMTYGSKVILSDIDIDDYVLDTDLENYKKSVELYNKENKLDNIETVRKFSVSDDGLVLLYDGSPIQTEIDLSGYVTDLDMIATNLNAKVSYTGALETKNLQEILNYIFSDSFSPHTNPDGTVNLTNYYTKKEVDDRLFIASNSAKLLVENAIGYSSVSTTTVTYCGDIECGDIELCDSITVGDTFLDISNSILDRKQLIVDALASKNIVNTTKADDLGSYADAIRNILLQTTSTIKVVKLNMSAVSSHQEVLSNPINIEELATSVLKFVPGDTGIIEYTCGFDNTDSSNFIYQDTTTFDGVMHQLDKTITKSISDTNTTPNGIFSTVDLDVSAFNSVESIEIDSTNSSLVISGTNLPSIVLPIGDINLTNVLNLNKINWITQVNGSGILKLAISINKGVTWNYFDGSSWAVLDITNLSNFKANGMDTDFVNALTSDSLELLRKNSKTIRFAYYLEKKNTSDVVNNDKIELLVDMQGKTIIAPQTSFSYALESDMKTITYNINTSGTYTFVYADKI